MTVTKTFLHIQKMEVFGIVSGSGGSGAIPSEEGGMIQIKPGQCSMSTHYQKSESFAAKNAVTGGPDSFCHTDEGVGEYWQATLDGTYNITKIKVKNRDQCGGRIANSHVMVDNVMVGAFPSKTVDGQWYEFDVNQKGKTVKIVTVNKTHLHFAT